MGNFEDADINHQNGVEALTVVVRQPPSTKPPRNAFPLKDRTRVIKRMEGERNSAPDGGWGWFVILAAHSTLIFREGIAKCLGVFLKTFQTYFQTSTSLIGWISSFCITAADLTGLISGPLCQKLGCRPVAMIGGFFSGLGLIAASFVNGVVALCVCLTVSGFGLGLALTPSLTMISHYFAKRYSLANGLAYSGSGVGILVLAPLSQVFLDRYGWRGAIMLLGALCLNVSVCGAMLRPLPKPKKPRDIQQYEPLLRNEEIEDLATELTEEIDEEDVAEEDTNEVEKDEKIKKTHKKSALKQITETLALKLFTNPSFVILLVVQFCARFTYMGWLIYLVPHAIQRGVTPMDATLIASAAGISNIFSRAFHGVVIDWKILSALQMLVLSCILASTTLLLDPLMQSYVFLMVGSLLYGLAGGIIFPVCVVRMKQVVGVDKLANALGWSYGFAGMGRMIAAFLTGWLFDYFGNYNISFILLGAVQGFAVLILFVDCIIEYRR
ncbi:Monocarboxylate transporter 1 [Holothuria leucospilota]|uniref:Monocarboxylate transporter 1 n=1 Tax=Holothuria leucospilota TaxID=206669 RepID=A0A9Q1BWV8_HOLLE|nr:Monocarboxylate transporter 1 [Holothuria leucospilota]